MDFDLPYQNDFLKVIQSRADAQNLANVQNLIEERYQPRLGVYPRNFIARAIGVLLATQLRPLVRVFSEDIVQDVLIRFFRASPPGTTELTAAIKGLPDFVRASGNEPYHHLFAVLSDVVQTAHMLLAGPDPRGSLCLEQHLQHFAHFIQPAGDLALYEAWVYPELYPEQVFSPDNFLQNCSGLLLLKISPFAATTIRVPPTLFPVANHLIRGLELASALALLDEEEMEKTDSENLGNFLEACQRALHQS